MSANPAARPHDGGPRNLTAASIPAQGNLLPSRKGPGREQVRENTPHLDGKNRALRPGSWETVCLLARRDGVKDLRRIARQAGLREPEVAAAIQAELEFAVRIRARFRTMLSFVVTSTADRLISECETECREERIA